MGNSNYRAKPNDLLVVKTKNRWERDLFGMQNVTTPTAWSEAGFGENVKINITEYVWLSQNSPNTGLWSKFANNHRWARELNTNIENHIKAKTTPLKRYRVNRLQGLSKTFPAWYYKQTQLALYPWNVGGFDTLVRDFLSDLSNSKNVTKYFASSEPLIYSQSSIVQSAIDSAESLRSTYGNSFKIAESSSSGWILLNIGGKALWAKNVPIDSTKTITDKNGNKTVESELYYQLTVIEKTKGQPKISMLSASQTDTPQSEIISAIQTIISPELKTVSVPIQGNFGEEVEPEPQLQSFTITEKNRLLSADTKWIEPKTTIAISNSGTDLSASLFYSGGTSSSSSASDLNALGNRSGQVLSIVSGALMLSNDLSSAAKVIWKNKKYLLFNDKYYLTPNITLTEDASLAQEVTVTDTSGVCLIRNSSNFKILSSVFLEWVPANESIEMNSWVKL